MKNPKIVFKNNYANAKIKTLFELSPPVVYQIKTIRSCLLPEYYDKKKVRNTYNNDNNENRKSNERKNQYNVNIKSPKMISLEK